MSASAAPPVTAGDVLTLEELRDLRAVSRWRGTRPARLDGDCRGDDRLRALAFVRRDGRGGGGDRGPPARARGPPARGRALAPLLSSPRERPAGAVALRLSSLGRAPALPAPASSPSPPHAPSGRSRSRAGRDLSDRAGHILARRLFRLDWCDRRDSTAGHSPVASRPVWRLAAVARPAGQQCRPVRRAGGP